MKNSIYYIAIICLSGCATLFGDKTQNIRFESIPNGAKVYVDGNYVGATPVNYTAQMDVNTRSVTYIQDGMHSREFTIMATNFLSNQLSNTQKALCYVDYIPASILTLGTTLLVDLATNACNRFNTSYSKVMVSEKSTLVTDENPVFQTSHNGNINNNHP
jgi:hypothetical protein